jgi:hypothetical protein
MNLSANTGFYPSSFTSANNFYFYTNLVTRTFSTISPDYITVSFSMPGIAFLNVQLTTSALVPVGNVFQIYGQSQTNFIINVGKVAIGGIRVEAVAASPLSTSLQYSFQILQRFTTSVILQNLIAPVNANDASTKNYVDTRSNLIRNTVDFPASGDSRVFTRVRGPVVRSGTTTLTNEMVIATGIFSPSGNNSGTSVTFGTTFSATPAVFAFCVNPSDSTSSILAAKAISVSATGATFITSFRAVSSGFANSNETFVYFAIG